MRLLYLSLSGAQFRGWALVACVGEQLMIFTTNHPEQLDEVLLRVGWMDRKIHLSYCRPIAIRILEELPRSNRGTSVDTAVLLAELEITFVDVTKVFTRYDAKGEHMMPR
ncbi:hypothetical protein ZIOFF_041023 [Zingiber officinale]|uniref:ATPase AAA-type core domain-containing protein n=1 Tax=Zingiber officinale TaxID=94328 RepID=A0A8J5G510_ZINOF|nr:hypothetical protein ZIOFF_041023 [Zingiber officinale]